MFFSSFSPSFHSSFSLPPSSSSSSLSSSLLYSSFSSRTLEPFVPMMTSSVSTETAMPTLQTDCGGLIYFASTDLLTIESPNYPNPYPPNLHCLWSVHGTQGSTIKGTFISFHLHTSSASLAVYDRLGDDDATRILSATGFVIPPSFTASQAINVVFTTGPITQQSGGFSLVLVLTAVCSPTVCHNDGACLETSEGIVYCVCQPGFTGITCESRESETISNNNLSSTGSLHVETWAIVLISVVVILLVILAIVVWLVHHRQPCRGPIVADYHAWQLHKISAIPAMGPDSQTSSPRDDTNIEPTPMIRRKDPSPIARIAPIHSESDIEPTLNSADRGRLGDIDGSPWLPTRRMFRHIKWNSSHSPNHSYKIAQSLNPSDDDAMNDTVLETMLDKKEVYHPDFHIDFNDDEDEDDVENDDEIGNEDGVINDSKIEKEHEVETDDDVGNDNVESNDDVENDDVNNDHAEYVVNDDDVDDKEEDVDGDAKDDASSMGLDVDGDAKDDTSSMGLDEFMIDMLRKKDEETEKIEHTLTRL
ncbi:uncharacterized protein LOC100891039 isoform X2 [Strongylocentrotus purpuratus]|uniref:Uncharacterized protein n=1 Tax=Strongylocentrotus purpuratus TaxID=7668 RepID=A0A7M7HNT2_STRPU|nr:uncharacterized protein LOC100891039 isoform X2 [Strongylocentrotus purpuratus]